MKVMMPGLVWRFIKNILLWVAAYCFVAYLFLPLLWRHYEHNPSLQNTPKLTRNGEGIPGDPLNVGLVGTQGEVVNALLQAGWVPADPLTFKTTLRLATSVLLKRRYPKAPISQMYLEGRKQDLSFELPVGRGIKERHHVRFWQSHETRQDGRPLWLGSATFDKKIGLSRMTAKLTHHIDADIDEERDKLIEDIHQANQLVSVYQVTGVGATFHGFNGEGDWYYTDGEMTLGILAQGNALQKTEPTRLPNPTLVNFKNQILLCFKKLKHNRT